MTRTAIIAAAALAIGTVAHAGEPMSPLTIAQQIFAEADTDRDGALTETEHKAAGLGRFGASFAAFDSNKDSRISWEEYRALFLQHHKAPGGREA